MGILRRVASRQKDRLVTFFRLLYTDYREVAVDTVATYRTKPLKSSLYTLLVAGGVYSHLCRPSAASYGSALTEANLDVARLMPSERNDAVCRRVLELRLADETRHLRHLDLIFLSVVWRADFPRENATFPARCKHLRPAPATWLGRVEDVGCWNRWHRLERLMEDYDVNPEVVDSLAEERLGWWRSARRAWRTTLRRQYT